MANLQALRAELDAGHPDTGAYNADAQLAADQINAVNRTVNVSSLSGDQLFSATDSTEFGALTDHKQNIWLAFCGRDSIDPFGASNVALVNWIFGGGSATITALASLRTRSVSRADELGIGRVAAGTVEQARAL
jgi:hypothetical protein